MPYQEFVIPELNYTPLHPKYLKRNSNRKALMVFSIFILPFLISTYVTVRAIKYSTVKISANVMPSPTPVYNPLQDPVGIDSPATLPVGLASNKVFYTDGVNIRSYDVQTKEEKQWTQFPNDVNLDFFDFDNSKPYVYYSNLQVIDENTLGFARCERLQKNAQCGISYLSLINQQVTEVEKLPYKILVHWLDWYDKDTYAYISIKGYSDERNDVRWKLVYKDGVTERVLEDTPIVSDGRVVGMYMDVENLSFSPDGNYLLQISTAYPRSDKDFNTYIYDLKNNVKKVITDSSASNWIDSQTVIFNKANFGDEDLSFHTYNVLTEQKEKVLNMDRNDVGANPIKGGNKMIYRRETESGYTIWFYDFVTKEKKIVLVNANPGPWITNDLIMFTELSTTQFSDMHKMEGVANLFSLKEKRKVGKVPNLRSNYVTTQYRSNYLDHAYQLLF